MIYERIKKILSEQFEIENVDLNTVIREDLNLDSIGILEFVMAIIRYCIAAARKGSMSCGENRSGHFRYPLRIFTRVATLKSASVCAISIELERR